MLLADVDRAAATPTALAPPLPAAVILWLETLVAGDRAGSAGDVAGAVAGGTAGRATRRTPYTSAVFTTASRPPETWSV